MFVNFPLIAAPLLVIQKFVSTVLPLEEELSSQITVDVCPSNQTADDKYKTNKQTTNHIPTTVSPQPPPIKIQITQGLGCNTAKVTGVNTFSHSSVSLIHSFCSEFIEEQPK